MFYTCLLLTRWNAELLAMAARSVNDAWKLLAPGASWSRVASAPVNPDLTILGLNRMPSSEADLRRAYRHAAKTAHPDVGGNADAFRAVSEAFERLAHRDT
jgi:hypothetical protein